MSSTHLAASRRTSSRVRKPKGCGMTAIGKSGQPSDLSCARPNVTNEVEQNSADADRLSFGIRYYFDSVDDTRGPLALAAFIDPATWVSVYCGATPLPDGAPRALARVPAIVMDRISRALARAFSICSIRNSTGRQGAPKLPCRNCEHDYSDVAGV